MSRNTAFATKAPVIPDVTTEELILDVLISRHKLGESLWPFDKCHLSALGTLEKRGLICTQPGVVRGTTRASLSNHALAMLTIHGDDIFAISEAGTDASERNSEPKSSCKDSCRPRCPECRMGLGSHLTCDPHCDHHVLI